MRIILLRHEERNLDIGFYSNLTINGKINSIKLSSKLEKENIDVIFSSPFIRTLQTICPYSIQYNKKVNIEYALYEYIHNPYFLIYNQLNNVDNIDDEDLKNIIDKNYNSIISTNEIKILENEKNLEDRIIKFFNYLMINYKGKTVLLVTHKAIINKIKDIYIKDTSLDTEFDMGHFIILRQINYPQHNKLVN